MLSKDRASLRKKWQDALVVADQFEIVTEVATQKQKIPDVIALVSSGFVGLAI